MNKEDVKVSIFYKVGMSGKGHHHRQAGGLAANALHSTDVLRRKGVSIDLHQVTSYDELVKAVDETKPTHVVIEAVWVNALQAGDLARKNPATQVVVRAHSKIGFLQVEPEAIDTIREIIELHDSLPNLWFSSNNHEFSDAVNEVYGPCLHLPNLYDSEGAPPRTRQDDEILRIASFGATRLLKLHPAAALAALQVATRLDRDLEFYVNVDRTPGGDSVRKTMRNMFDGLKMSKLVELGWQDSDEFRKTIASMDLVMQLSATETFCMVAADAVSSGVPVVTGPAVSWLAGCGVAPIDDTGRVAYVSVGLLTDSKAAKKQKAHLKHYVEYSVDKWMEFLGLPKTRRCFLW